MNTASQRIILIAAMDSIGGIGSQGNLLWHLPNDMKFFKNSTWGHPVIMGRKTYESLKKPLLGRTNIVLSRQLTPIPNLVSACSVQDAIEKSTLLQSNSVFVIGGGEIYRSFLPYATDLYLTRVNAQFPAADTFFPSIDWQNWQLNSDWFFAADERNAYSHHIQKWQKK